MLGLARDEARTGSRRSYRPFEAARRTEHAYARDLRKIARHIADIVLGFPVGDPASLPWVDQALARYAEMLAPWADSVAKRMLGDVERREARQWFDFADEMSQALRHEIRAAPTGHVLRRRLADQVDLITSLPVEAGKRVHRLTMEAVASGARPESIAAEIMRIGQVTRSRATLIARTEVARTQSELTMARAQAVGCEGYIWRTAGDQSVRKLHRKLEGKFIRWDDPPVAGERGERAHAGQIFNCRCSLSPVIPARFG